MSSKSLTAGPLEMKILGLFNTEGQALSVGDVQRLLKEGGDDLAYTTVMTVVSRLYDKGFFRRDKIGRQYVYSFQKNQKQMGQDFIRRLKVTLFGKEKLKPILALIDDETNLTLDELKALQRAVNDRIKKESSSG